MNTISTHSQRGPAGSGRRRLGALLLVAVLLPLLASTGTVSAQGVFERPLRIAVILPQEAEAPLGEGELPGEASQAARLGAEFAREELQHNASLLGIDVDVLVSFAGEAEVVQEAERLVEEEGAFGLIGGFGLGQATALADFAVQAEIPFLNIGTSDDRLRNESCSQYTFHVEPSDAMYIDALTGWFIRAGFRRWAFVHEDSEYGEELYRRADWALDERHFGGREVARVAVAEGEAEPDWQKVFRSLRRGRPEVVMVLLDPKRQLEFLRRSAEGDEGWETAGLPLADAQTRSFYLSWATAAPDDEDLFRASAWEATIDSYGAREFNERFRERTGVPMDASAWAAYQAIRILYDSAIATRSLEGPELAAHLADPNAVFDVWKGIGVTFRPWDHQLRQSLFLVQLSAVDENRASITLVGELPALYLPRTDPVERLDQLGDLRNRSSCRFG